MRRWVAREGGVEFGEGADPVPQPGELLVRVLACGVCRTDLHVIDHDLPVHRPGVVPGHQVVGDVIGVGPGVRLALVGDRVGVAWLHHTCGICGWCRTGRENLCPDALFTGWDLDGGYAELITVPEAYAYALPQDADPLETAPLLCAGIIGYRALQRAALPPGGRLGIYGFGSSAHLTAQLAIAAGSEVYVLTRGADNQKLARSMGMTFVGGERDDPPVPLDSAIVFAPAGDLVPVALRATARGGTVVSAGVYMSEIPAMDYDTTLFLERDLRSVTANTRGDGDAFLALARHLALRPQVTVRPFEEVRRALDDLRTGRASGSIVIAVT
jgi:propanol-preferring alcohol dehydrogenase